MSVLKVNGRRGAFLLLFGIMFSLIGYGITLPLNRPQLFLDELLPLSIKVAIWAVPGIIGIIASFVKRPRWIILGYSALSIPLGVKVVSFMTSPLVFDIDIRGSVIGVMVYGTLLSALMIVASWPESQAFERLGEKYVHIEENNGE